MVTSNSAIMIAYSKLSKLDFKNVDRKFGEKYANYDIDTVRDETLRFLSLAAGNYRIAPPKIIDDYWHEFILHTKMYSEYCQTVFGRFIHHQPNDGSKKQRNIDHEIFWEALQRYEDTFGEPVLTLWGIEYKKGGKKDVCKK